MRGRIERVAVVGGEIVGWSAAAALKRRLPYLEVTLVPAACASEDLANRLISTLPSIGGFHNDIGLGEEDTIARAASAPRLGSRFSGWNSRGAPYVHAYGSHGEPIAGASFHFQWLRARHSGLEAPFEDFSVAAAIGKAGRELPPNAARGLADVQYGLQIDRQLYGSLLEAFAVHLGVRSAGAAYADVQEREDGFIGAVVLDDGRTIDADLFLDCTGPRRLLRSRLSDSFEDWSHWLPCDRIEIEELASDGTMRLLDDVQADQGGWSWLATSTRTMSRGRCFAREFTSEVPTGDPLKLEQGMVADPWLRNCVAVGGAAVSVEPLEWTNLHLVHSALDRIVSMMPAADCDPSELTEYNRQSSAEAIRIRDFILLHYVTADRAGPFWEAARKVDLPDSLRHSLALFRARGRLPFYEEETFSRDSWHTVLFGQGVLPQRVDPIVDVVDPLVAAAAMTRHRRFIETQVAALAMVRKPTAYSVG